MGFLFYVLHSLGKNVWPKREYKNHSGGTFGGMKVFCIFIFIKKQMDES
jgi:hypothetical protein